MYLILEKDNSIIMYGDAFGYDSHGLPTLVNEKTSFPKYVTVCEVDEIPSDVTVEKYCYTESEGFYINPNWEEPNPYNIPNEVYNSIIDDYTNELFEMGVL